MAEKYPECEKLAKVSKESQVVGEFLEWLQNEKEIALAKWAQVEGSVFSNSNLFLVHDSTESLLAEFFEIDMNKVEEERQQILKELRESKQ